MRGQIEAPQPHLERHLEQVTVRLALLKSHETPAVLKLYGEFFTDGPCGRKSHELLHTSYTARGKHIG